MMVQPDKRRLHLTSKPFLVKTDFIPVSTFEDAKVGLITEGIISKISRHGLLINLMGEQRGWVPAHHMSSEPIDFPEKVFWPGQSVKCQIKSVDEEKRNLTLSLNINKNETDRMAKNFEMAEKLTLGKFYSVKVLYFMFIFSGQIQFFKQIIFGAKIQIRLSNILDIRSFSLLVKFKAKFSSHANAI